MIAEAHTKDRRRKQTMTAPPKFPGNGLEEVNVPGQNYLRDALTSCTDPLKAIETFQVNFAEKKKTNFFFLSMYSIMTHTHTHTD